MGNNLPVAGLRLVVENETGYLKAVDVVNKRTEAVGEKMKETAAKASPLDKALGKVGMSFDDLKSKLTQVTGISPKVVDAIGEVVQGIVSIPPSVALALGAIAALVAAFLALGARGAALQGLTDSFDRLTNSVGISSQTLLKDLRAASEGTVSDFDLIRRANIALVGATGEFGKQFGVALPKILEAARAAARATGQDVEFLYNSLVTGIKRASPRLIDNTGIVLKISEANQALADSLGKTVDQLTLEEQQIAVLNATVAAGQELIDSMGVAHETAAEKIARSQATITNIFDTLALAVQPAYEAVLDVVNGVLLGIQNFVRTLAPIINFIAQVVGGVINVLYQLGVAIQSIIGETVHRVGELLGLGSGGLGEQLRNGAIASFQAYADGITGVVTKVILPVITWLAKSIADFLIGESPPPKGPLSKIDRGGENLMLAWLDGIAGVSLAPVEQVVADVNLALGAIGKASLGAVTARLATLDKALEPFQNKLEIVKSQFEAIATPAKAALDAIDRQIAEAEGALAMGDETAANTIRQLDAQRAAIQANLDAQQKVVDSAEIQLALAQAQQSQERALLNIRKSQFVETKKVASAAEKIGKAEKLPTGSGADLAAPGTPQVAIPSLSGESVVPGDRQSGTEFAAGLLESVSQFGIEAVGVDNILQIESAVGDLQSQLNRFQGVDVGQSIANRFSGLTDAFNPEVEGSVANKVSTFFSGDASTPGSLASFVAGIPLTLENLRSSIDTGLNDFFSSIFDPNIEGSPAQIIQTLTADSSVENSIAWFFAQIPGRITTAVTELSNTIQTTIIDPVSDFLTGTEPGQLGGIIQSAVDFFVGLPSAITTAVSSIGLAIHEGIVIPVVEGINAMIGAVEDGLRNLANGALDLVGSLLSGLGAFAPAELSQAISTLRASVSSLSLPKIFLPAFEAPGAATGGVFSGGLMKVGERGTEYLANATKTAVFPHDFVTAIQGLTDVLVQPQPITMGAGNTYNNSTYNFNGVQSDNDARRRFNTLRAGMR